MDMVALVSRFALATVFLVAGLAKVVDRDRVARAVGRYGFLSSAQSGWVATWLPRGEMVCACLLFLGVWPSVVAGVLGLALLVFTGAMIRVLAKGEKIECGCFGSPSAGRVTRVSVARNLLLLIGAMVVVWHPSAAATLIAGERNGVTANTAWAAVMIGTATVFAALLAAEAWRASQTVRAMLPRGEVLP